jgi:hypothetical protein
MAAVLKRFSSLKRNEPLGCRVTCFTDEQRMLKPELRTEEGALIAKKDRSAACMRWHAYNK